MPAAIAMSSPGRTCRWQSASLAVSVRQGSMTTSPSPRRLASWNDLMVLTFARPPAPETIGLLPKMSVTSASIALMAPPPQTPIRPRASALPGWSIVTALNMRPSPSAFMNAACIGQLHWLARLLVPMYEAMASGPCSSRIARSCTAISSMATSTGMAVKEPSGRRFCEWRSRCGDVYCSGTARPFTHEYPWYTGLAGSPTTFTGRPSSMSTRTGHVMSHVRQIEAWRVTVIETSSSAQTVIREPDARTREARRCTRCRRR